MRYHYLWKKLLASISSKIGYILCSARVYPISLMGIATKTIGLTRF